ncbi:MAG TPA: LLM class flavin-dependent oxidoreductase, partial [Myxococcales bacterium]|nr:LLM class flavin-dependent oxidoreductase [Myxococcales bacterium]
MIKAGMFQLFETLGQIDIGQAYRQCVDEAVFGEEIGFDAVCPAEHHFGANYGIMPQTEMFLSWVAARTSRIRLWPMVMVAPIHEPLRLAERVAMLDQFSQGRMVFSVGTGYRKYEFDGLGVDINDSTDRLRECMDICMQAFGDGKVNHQGKHFQVNDVEVFPKPYQSPRPPVYLTTARDDSVRWAASQGYGVLPAAGFSPFELKHTYDIHDQVSREHGHGILETRPFFKWIYVDEDENRAREVAQNYF